MKSNYKYEKQDDFNFLLKLFDKAEIINLEEFNSN